MTGGAGYVGSHAVKALVDAGYDVVVYDDLSAGHREATCGQPLVVGNILETEGIRQTIRQWNVKAVLHFAASLSVSQSVRDPVGYYRQNVTGTLSLLEAMAAESVRFLILSSHQAYQYLWGDETCGRASSASFWFSLWFTQCFATLFQCGGGRSRWNSRGRTQS